MPPTWKLSPAQQRHQELLSAQGSRRRKALESLRSVEIPYRRALHAALGAGCPQSEIARVAGVSRQVVNVAATRTDPGVKLRIWQEEGKPSRASALETVASTAPAWREARALLVSTTADLVQQMGIAAHCGDTLPPSVLVAASGLSSNAGYRYLDLLKFRRSANLALVNSGIQGRNDPESGLVDDGKVDLVGTHLVARIHGHRDPVVDNAMRRGMSAEDAVSADAMQVARLMADALEDAGFSGDWDRLGRSGWCIIRKR